jgi:hypothetical protein
MSDDAERARLRALPVTRTTKLLVMNSGVREWVSNGRLFTVIGKPRPHRIDEDDPSIYGHQLLGHEGERAWMVTVEIRGDQGR